MDLNICREGMYNGKEGFGMGRQTPTKAFLLYGQNPMKIDRIMRIKKKDFFVQPLDQTIAKRWRIFQYFYLISSEITTFWKKGTMRPESWKKLPFL